MEEGRTELEFDEFEKLLGEIPNATSGNPHFEESEPKRAYLDESLSSLCMNSYKGPLGKKLQYNGRLDYGKNLLNKIQQSPIKRAQPEETNLPDTQPLTSAFVELSFHDGVTMEAVNPTSANCRTIQNSNFSLDGKFTNSLKKQISSMDSPMIAVPTIQLPDNVPSTKVGRQSTNLSKVNPEELKRFQVTYCHPNENFSAAVPVAHVVHGFQFLSNQPVPGMQFPFMSDQQHVFLDAQSRLPYLHSQQINSHQIDWRNFEEEHYCRMHQRYVQQLHNQRLEDQHLVPENHNLLSRITGRNPRHPHFEVPLCHQLGLFNQEPFWNNYAMTRSLNQSNPAFSSTDFNVMGVLDKVGMRSFPEKILTRTHGVDTLKALKFGSVGANESLIHVGENENSSSNGQCRHNLSIPCSGYFQLDNLNPWCLLPDTTDLKGIPQKYNSLDEVTGKLYLMAKDQHGCRFLQRKFSEGTPEEVEKIFLEIINHIVELMTDPFGNYLVQKLLEVCDEDQQKQIIHSITRKSGELVRISCDMHGTRAVQKVIETLKTPEQFSMVVSALKPGIVTLIKNMNGNHVAQRCLQYLNPEYSEFLFEAVTTNCVELATDRHGCCVLQKCLIHSDGEQRRRLICEITTNALILSQDPFGNYVVQFVFELQLPWATVDILDQLEGSYGDLSMQKHSSNVVERSLKYAGEERRPRIIQELIDNPRLDQIMQDPYGNYVIQAALNQSKGTLHSMLVDAIKPHLPVLRTSPYGKKVLSGNGLKK
ncbi:hypothetical protein FNV43_RR14075 [Rhamnella rubrinervis]|uniref:PUM-HD domain-containing protein n=1 Tax=Rhamnella rubrinervis TaxID=2594499 RepID=A0A8K0MG32_9ROSA|nr:hypothetical protein FNV43_RR14075 [Rhamnella rubrinervis]